MNDDAEWNDFDSVYLNNIPADGPSDAIGTAGISGNIRDVFR